MLRHPFILAFISLTLGTLAAHFPVPILGVILGMCGLVALWRWPLVGLLGLILATLLGEFGRIQIGWLATSPLDILAPLIVGIWVLRKISYRENFTIPPGGFWLIGFWLMAIISLMLGSAVLQDGELTKPLLYLVRFIGGSALFFLCYDLKPLQRQLLERSLYLTLTLLALSGFVLLQLIPDFAAAGLAELGWDPHIGRLTSTWLDPNFVGGAFTLGLALIGSRLLDEKKWSGRLLFGSLAGVLLLALLLTYSRSALLAFAVAGLIIGVLRSRSALIIGICIAILGVGVSTRLQERLGEFATSIVSVGTETMQTMDPTASLRVDSWREALRIWEGAPLLGVGFGTYVVHQRFAPGDSHAATGADSSLLTLGATTGIIGIILLLGFLSQVFLTAWLGRRDPLTRGFLAGGAGLLIHAIFVNSLLFPPLTIYFFVLAGLALHHDHRIVIPAQAPKGPPHGGNPKNKQ